MVMHLGRTRQLLAAAVVTVALIACSSNDADRTADDTAGAPAAARPSADDMDDRVERALDTDSTLGVFGLDADDDDGRIILKGAVRTEAQKTLAMQIATREAGGVAVDNRIRVDAGISATRARPQDADEVEDQIEDAIKADSSLRALNIDVDEDNGQIVLEGRVSTAAQRAAVETLAKRHAGTIAVVNRIRVE